MPLSSQYIDKKFENVNNKLDEITNKLSSLELKLTKRVDRNSFVISGLLWFIGIVVAANIVCLVRYLW